MPSAWVRDVLTAQNEEEEMLLRHVRGDCHNGAVCLLCQASARANQAELRLRSEKRTVESIISGDPIPLPTKADAVREYAAKMATAASPVMSLQDAVTAFDAALPKALIRSHPRWVHNRIMTVKMIREFGTANGQAPSADAIREHYMGLLWPWMADGTPDESSGC